MDVIEYKCPNCGGAVAFDSSSQQMLCPYCDTKFDVAAMQSLAEPVAPDNMDWEMPKSQWEAGEQEGMGVYICQSCAGEIVADSTLGATSCPYCGNKLVMTAQFSGSLKPDLIIPFKLDKEAAKKALKDYYAGKFLLPNSFKDENRINEIKGVYVPFWLFNSEASANVRYKATKLRTWEDSKFRYTETSHFNIIRNGNLAFDDIPVDGSSKMRDDVMESIEPFALEAAKDYSSAYLAGYMADKYDVDADASIVRANERIKKSTESKFRETVTGYNTVNVENSSVNLKGGKARYALLPVWMLTTIWNDTSYLFAMNGQTGKLIGDLPMDKSKYQKVFMGVFAGVTALLYLLQMLL